MNKFQKNLKDCFEFFKIIHKYLHHSSDNLPPAINITKKKPPLSGQPFSVIQLLIIVFTCKPIFQRTLFYVTFFHPQSLSLHWGLFMFCSFGTSIKKAYKYFLVYTLFNCILFPSLLRLRRRCIFPVFKYLPNLIFQYGNIIDNRSPNFI